MTIVDTTTAASARRIQYTAQAADFGRVVYTVAGLGSFTLCPARREDTQSHLTVLYGKTLGYSTDRGSVHDRPTVRGVVLDGAAEFHPIEMRPDSYDWLTVTCDTQSRALKPYNAGPKVTRRTAEIVYVLATDYLNRDDYRDLVVAAYRSYACGWVNHHENKLAELRGRVVELTKHMAGHFSEAERWRRVRNGSRQQLPPVLARPDTREGAAIYLLHAEMSKIIEQAGDLNGGDAVMRLCSWFDDLGLPLPDPDDD